jgi:hypothetical protein
MVTIQEAGGITAALVGVGVTGAVGLLVLSQISTSGSFSGAALGVINNITTSLSNMFGLFPVLGTVFGAVIILGAVALIGYSVYQKMQ